MSIRNIERLYTQKLFELLKVMEIKDVDFIGINISEKGDFEFKIYPEPETNLKSIPDESNLCKYLLQNKLVRSKCYAYSCRGKRVYIALKNRNNKNMFRFYQALEKEYPYICQSAEEIRAMSLMKVSRDLDYRYASLHMVGIKRLFVKDSVVSIEWITREMPYPNRPGYKYKYNDLYYLKYLKSLNILPVSLLCDCVNIFFMNPLKYGKLHVWLVAIDYYVDGRKKYKLYLKGEEGIVVAEILEVFCKISPNLQSEIEQIYNFINKHEELNLYGFSIGLDTNNNYSFNFYLIED